MTLLHLAAVLLFIPSVCASLNCTSYLTLNVSNSPSPPSSDTRSLWDIIWSCAATIFACTWTAIHPNIPGMDEKKAAVISRRLFSMVVALIAPELVITWAAQQFFSARRVATEFNYPIRLKHEFAFLHTIQESNERHNRTSSAPGPEFTEWTVTHGFFACMGGFMLYVDDKPRATLTPRELQHFISDGSVDMPVITEADIEDRSKGDVLSKGVAILQLVGFVLQLVARYVQKLPITLLEIDTLAVAAATCIAYGLWWKKPKDVGRPYVVHWKATTSPGPLFYEYVVNSLAWNGSDSSAF
ncbi:uncharacterized protein EDB91DRAFT_1085229 [Suillus paluster]|uniref:uncharacterized protein n=1 Tax=Suillus paluster TaxID=48578 RepID=UPI001B860168|nr:uncharacterized protein EDB91DRAFT_1085229 [Suillus paluster]KAG1730934.1 hypothetical protein EDB91DRAFT_1085229 [Suillus paluster]